MESSGLKISFSGFNRKHWRCGGWRSPIEGGLWHEANDAPAQEGGRDIKEGGKHQ